MSPECREIVGGLMALGICLMLYGVWPAFSAWRANRRLMRAFRRDLEVFDSRHVDVWARQSGREPPR